MARAFAVSDGSSPKLPSRRTLTWPATALTSVTIAPSRSAISSKVTLSSTAWLRVSCTIAIEPTRRTASSRAALADGRVDPAGLEAQQGRDRLEVVLHPVVDLADGGVLGDQLAVAAAQVGHVAHQDQPTDQLPLGPQRDRPDDQGHLVVADLGVALSPGPEHGAERLLVGSPPGRHQVAGQVGQREPGQVAGDAEPAVDRQRVGARVDHPARPRRRAGSRRPPGRCRRGRCAARGAGSVRPRSSG